MDANDAQSTEVDGPRVRRVLVVAVWGELALLACTWRLWFGTSEFPRIPLFAGQLEYSIVLQRGISVAFVLALLVTLWLLHQPTWSKCGRRGLMPAVGLGFAAVICNQQCLQPWHWLFLSMTCGWLLIGTVEYQALVRRMIGCIYLFAALSRLGPGIDSGMNRQVVTILLELIGLTRAADNPDFLRVLCVGATLVELLAGVLLLVRVKSRFGVLAAVLMHGILILVLGPWGLGQHLAVLVWNGILAVLVWVVGWESRGLTNHGGWRLKTATLCCVVWPALALMGITDNWTGWQVYSPRPEILQLQISALDTGRLPESLQLWVEDPAPLEEWSNVRLDRWSLDQTGAPLYPQARFYHAVVEHVLKDVAPDASVRARLSSPQSPYWWRRQSVDMGDRIELRNAAARYWLNAGS